MNELETSPDLSLRLHPWLAHNPSLAIKSLESQAQTASLHSKIYYCAMAAISIATFSLSFLTKLPSKGLSLIAVASIISTPYLAVNAAQYQSKKRALNQVITAEKAVFIQLQKIQNWSEAEINEFLLSHHLNPNPCVPIFSLLPGVARYLVSAQTALKAKEFAIEHLQAEGIADRGLRLAMRSMGWNILENQVVPAAIEAAFILRILDTPQADYFVSDMYEIIQKPFAERQFDLLYGPNDNYLVMRSNPDCSFSLQELLEDLNPDILKQKIFDPFPFRNR